jgi:salicylate hydroxylase
METLTPLTVTKYMERITPLNIAVATEQGMTDFPAEYEQIDIAIVGGGIGGAAAAIALQQAGFKVDVFEQATALREVGGAIVIREPSMALFGQWGIRDNLRPLTVMVNKVEMRDSQGRILGETPTKIEAEDPEFAYCVHRADLHNALVSQILPNRLHLGHRLALIANKSGYAEVGFENGRTIRARLVVGADGLRSMVRAALDNTPMTFLKMVTHRTIAPAALLPADMPNDRIRLWHSGKLVVNMIPIRGGTEVGISAGVPTPMPPKDLWSAVSADEIMSMYADFDPLITRMIEGRIVDITTHPIYDKDPIQRWADGHIVLVGDAAHPMAPMNGQGANQAILDADALAAALSVRHGDDLPSSLARYQDVRAPVTARIQTLSRTPPPSLARLMEAAATHPA